MLTSAHAFCAIVINVCNYYGINIYIGLPRFRVLVIEKELISGIIWLKTSQFGKFFLARIEINGTI
jgi:hypothetical protein